VPRKEFDIRHHQDTILQKRLPTNALGWGDLKTCNFSLIGAYPEIGPVPKIETHPTH
jgi:hypothetical protein